MLNKLSRLKYIFWFSSISSLMLLVVLGACTKPAPPASTSPYPYSNPPQNKTPVIQSVDIRKACGTDKQYNVICKATDPSNDTLSYLWSADSGTIQGDGSSIIWIAPEILGNYTVKVTVKDGKGGEAASSDTIDITGKPNQSPVIVKITKDAPDKIRIWNVVTIQCIAEDPEGDSLSYIWSTTGGKIQGQGNTIGWMAPGIQGNYTIHVKVIDNQCGQTEGNIDQEVFCCGDG